MSFVMFKAWKRLLMDLYTLSIWHYSIHTSMEFDRLKDAWSGLKWSPDCQDGFPLGVWSVSPKDSFYPHDQFLYVTFQYVFCAGCQQREWELDNNS